MKCSEILHILDDNLIEILQKENKALITALEKVSDYNSRLERQLSDERMKNLRLETERDALAAQNIKMMQSILYCTIYLDDNKLNSIATGSKAHVMLADAITATPLQCLADIKAEAVEDALAETYDEIRYRIGKDFANNIETIILDYAAKIRQGSE